MHFTKPAWVAHKDSSAKSDSTKRLSIFSVHVHPDGSRIATGGLDAKVRIWSTKPILNPASEESNKPPKSLCTLTMHTGPVLTVRWAHSGRWLASGSDDEIVMIWDLDPNAKGKVWGSDEVNVEGWKPMKRLPGHESDVTDVAWAPQDRYLASVGLDSKVLIWCGFTLERLHKLDQHQGFVKGVCWDPVGEFLATQSDDRSVKIWRTSDWSLEAEVKKPFEDSPGSTFFRRLSWSPDGAHITASNATNNKGFVFIAAVITRGTWTSDISLVGHENTVEVAAYNPHIFLRNPASPVATSNICSVVALGADDRSISVWQTKSARPLIVAKEVFDRQIMDLSWSWDGMTLYAASSDGTIAVFAFEQDELEGIAPHSVQEQYLSKFGFTLPPLPEGYSHPTRSAASSQPQPQSQTFDTTTIGGEVVNVLVAKRNNKRKRMGLTTTTSVPSAGAPSPFNGKRASFLPDPDVRMSGSKPTSPLGNASFFPTPDEQPFDTHSDWKTHDVLMGPTDSFSSKQEDDSRPVYRTLGGDRQRELVPVKEIQDGGSGWRSHASSSSGLDLPVPVTLTRITEDIEGGHVFEGLNPEDGGPTSVHLFKGKQTLWLDYIPSPVIAVHATAYFCAAAMLDGSLNVYSPSGRRLMATLNLGSPCSVMNGSKNCLLLITQAGLMYCWYAQVAKNTAFFPPVSVAPLMSSPNDTIESVSVRPNGTPIINCSNGTVYSYDTSLFSWVKISDRWWSEGSDVWQGRQRPQSSNRGIVAFVESRINVTPNERAAETPRPEWWTSAMTLGHLETRLHAARLLDSPAEYKQYLTLYAKKIADEGFRAKAEELIKELYGPIYWRPAEEKNNSWSPTVLGLVKRDLLKDVLGQFVKSRTLQKLGLEWQDLLKKVVSEES
ncbi:histone transcription regulator 1 [Rhodocollybia butyracea]|uniref:Protein HIR n=1 Tax=Rhodocollybia butyracea TaxID=206335 RepID=A0A9P5U7Y4_9AGAR|nr:histone transcription regulator 1 [Rhodocollybia butyracea]